MTQAFDAGTPSSSHALVLGEPRFPDGVLSAAGGSVEQAWRHLIRQHGAFKAAAQVAGPFAVALHLEDGSTFLAVDRFAIQTLCYRVEGSALSFASRADHWSREGARALDAQAIFDYLYFHVIPSPRTVHSGVSRVPPGHCVLFKQGQLAVEPYWRPAFAPQARPNFADLKEEFRGLLHQAVRRQLDGSQPACFLSGGTDSSSVAGLIGEVCGQPAATYSIGFDAQGYDEMSYARIAAKRYGTQHHEYYVTPEDLVASIPKVAAAYDQPFGNSSAVPAYHCALNAAQNGVTRLLAGDGGDELFGGNSRYATQRVFDWYQLVPGLLRKGLLEPIFNMRWVASTPGLKKGSNYIRQANTPLPYRGQEFNLLRRLGYDEVLTRAMRQGTDGESVVNQQGSVWQMADAQDELNKHLAYDWRYTLAENDLPKVVGTTSMAGVAVGFPFLDDDLLAFSMRLPVGYKLKGKNLRWFFKEALRGFLPDEIITKQKHGFGLPFGLWMLKHQGLRALATESVQSITARGFVRPEFSRRLVNDLLPEAPQYYGSMIWVLMMLEQWLRAHAPDYRYET